VDTILIDLIRSQGFCVLRNALCQREVLEAKERCLCDWHNFLKGQGRWFGGGALLGHLNYRPAPDLPVVGTILTDPHLIDYIRCVLNGDAGLFVMGGNVNMPGSGFQPVHTDGALDTRYLAVNIPLGDADESNGSLEVYPGSHLEKIRLDEFKKRYRGRSARVNTRTGDVILRHPNLWHRGTPNRSSVPRFMLAFGYGPRGAKRSKSFLLSDRNATLLKSVENDSIITVTTSTAGEFSPNYFSRTLSGYAKEVACRYTPGLFERIRISSRS
jgi:hypothetical protein